MFEVGAILYGFFKLSDIESKYKYAIVFDLTEEACLVTTFTTSRARSGVLNPTHGANPEKKPYRSYVFLKDIEIGTCPDTGLPFSFSKNTTVVPDIGFSIKSLAVFYASVTDLRKVCQLHKNEFTDLMYALYNCDTTLDWVKEILEKKLEELMSVDQE